MNPLTHYPRHPSAPDTYYINGAWAPAAITAVEKRFTDAEMNAEYWRSEFDYERAFHSICYLSGNWKADKFTTHERRAILERFATLPHHDDGPA
jgi:hypothetical protein